MSSSSTMKGTSPEFSTTATSVSSPSQSPNGNDILKDVYLWRKKKLSATILAFSTVTWVILEVYRFNFIPVVCWVAMFIVTSMFLWGNVARLFNREKPAMAVWEISEQFAMETQDACREMAEDGIRWMFRVGVEEKWFIFIEIIAGLWLLSMFAGLFSFLSFSYIGVVIGLTVPIICFKFEDKLKGFRDRVVAQGRRQYHAMVDRFHGKSESEQKIAEDKVKKVE